MNDGKKEGEYEGLKEGSKDGSILGNVEGTTVGRKLGMNEGSNDGDALGSTEGVVGAILGIGDPYPILFQVWPLSDENAIVDEPTATEKPELELEDKPIEYQVAEGNIVDATKEEP